MEKGAQQVGIFTHYRHPSMHKYYITVTLGIAPFEKFLFIVTVFDHRMSLSLTRGSKYTNKIYLEYRITKPNLE